VIEDASFAVRNYYNKFRVQYINHVQRTVVNIIRVLLPNFNVRLLTDRKIYIVVRRRARKVPI